VVELQPSDNACRNDDFELLCTPLHRLYAEIERAAASAPAVRHRVVADALRPYLAMPDLLRDTHCPCSPDRYVRHLLHAGRDHTILALVWRPGQMSPVHSHLSWCALGVHRGCMTETQFTMGAQGPVPRGCAQHDVGDVSHAPADLDAIHRLANLGTETAVSIHIYGARFDRLGEEVNRIWAA
jgi:predicted metal-dependent enzyme (double-stranded beta helix superfamily)